MRSTGEVLGMAASFGLAFFKAEEAARPALPTQGTVLISAADKTELLAEIGREFAALGFKIRATEGTQRFLANHGVASERIAKLSEGRPNIVDEIMNKNVQLVINTPIGKKSASDDSYIRKAAIKYKIPYITTLAAAQASVKGIAAYREGQDENAAGSESGVKSLQSYHRDLRGEA
jgi:carbamoyl-phosphate synthase large subunit